MAVVVPSLKLSCPLCSCYNSINNLHFSEVLSSDVVLLNELTSLIVDYFAPRSRIDERFQATWAFIATWSEVVGFENPTSLKLTA